MRFVQSAYTTQRNSILLKDNFAAHRTCQQSRHSQKQKLLKVLQKNFFSSEFLFHLSFINVVTVFKALEIMVRTIGIISLTLNLPQNAKRKMRRRVSRKQES
jgi:hypothetical protein